MQTWVPHWPLEQDSAEIRPSLPRNSALSPSISRSSQTQILRDSTEPYPRSGHLNVPAWSKSEVVGGDGEYTQVAGRSRERAKKKTMEARARAPIWCARVHGGARARLGVTIGESSERDLHLELSSPLLADGGAGTFMN